MRAIVIYLLMAGTCYADALGDAAICGLCGAGQRPVPVCRQVWTRDGGYQTVCE